MSTFAIVGIICIVMFIYIILKDRKPKEKKEPISIQDINDSRIADYLSYSKKTKTLTVKKKSKYIGEFLTASQILIDYNTKKPDSYVFTSATVGGVTTGGLEKITGKSSTRKISSGKYRLIYKRLTEDGTFIPEGEVEFVSLPEELLVNAMIGLKGYIYNNKIAILDEKLKKSKKNSAGTAMLLNAAMNAGGNTLASNYVNNFEVLEYPDYDKIKKIIDWLKSE